MASSTASPSLSTAADVLHLADATTGFRVLRGVLSTAFPTLAKIARDTAAEAAKAADERAAASARARLTHGTRYRAPETVTITDHRGCAEFIRRVLTEGAKSSSSKVVLDYVRAARVEMHRAQSRGRSRSQVVKQAPVPLLPRLSLPSWPPPMTSPSSHPLSPRELAAAIATLTQSHLWPMARQRVRVASSGAIMVTTAVDKYAKEVTLPEYWAAPMARTTTTTTPANHERSQVLRSVEALAAHGTMDDVAAIVAARGGEIAYLADIDGLPLLRCDPDGCALPRLNMEAFDYRDCVLRAAGAHLPGATTAYTYLGTEGTAFAAHVEDAHLGSFNGLVAGDPKVWYVVPPAHYDVAARVLLDFVAAAAQDPGASPRERTAATCATPLAHKWVFPLKPALDALTTAGVPVLREVQRCGDLMIIAPGALHWGFNTGNNVAVSTNVADDTVWPVAYNATGAVTCTCSDPALRHTFTVPTAALTITLPKMHSS